MHRFHCPDATSILTAKAGTSQPDHGGEALVNLQGDELRHARKVLRLTVGDEVSVFDGRGHVGWGRISRMTPGAAMVALDRAAFVLPSVPRLVIAAAMPKGPRATDMIHQLCQLGCDAFVPLRTARSVVDPRDAKLERLAKLVVESAKQSGQAYLMNIEPVQPLSRVLAMAGIAVKLIAAPPEGESEASGVDALSLAARLRGAGEVRVLIGPEGGWTTEELAAARDAGFERWALAPAVLRIETAAAAAATVVRYLCM